MKTFYDSDTDPSLILDKRVAVMGFGAQGRAHVLNLRDSGVEVTVGLREDSPSRTSCKTLGLCVENYRPKLMTIPNILTQNYDKLQRRVEKSNNPFQQKLIKSKNEKWHETISK